MLLRKVGGPEGSQTSCQALCSLHFLSTGHILNFTTGLHGLCLFDVHYREGNRAGRPPVYLYLLWVMYWECLKGGMWDPHI